MERQLVTLYALDRRRAEECLPELARALDGGTVGSLDAAGMVEIELTAGSRDEALARVRDAIAAIGADERFTFPETTGTGHTPPGRRGPPPDEQPPDEPPHLERGSPREARPAPSDETP
jgi:hypothetical protein